MWCHMLKQSHKVKQKEKEPRRENDLWMRHKNIAGSVTGECGARYPRLGSSS